MKVYKENIERWQKFLTSDYFQTLKNENSPEIKWILNTLYVDADAKDKTLYIQLGEKFGLPYKNNYLIDEVGGLEIKLSADIIFGCSKLFRICGEDYQQLMLDYESIRSNLNLHFIWPKHKIPTINTQRYVMYYDRIDCLLYDLKLFFQGQNTPMLSVYNSDVTKIWLSQFDKDFEYFIDKMQLNNFVNNRYEVLDISTKNLKTMNSILSAKEVFRNLDEYTRCLLTLNREGVYN